MGKCKDILGYNGTNGVNWVVSDMILGKLIYKWEYISNCNETYTRPHELPNLFEMRGDFGQAIHNWRCQWDVYYLLQVYPKWRDLMWVKQWNHPYADGWYPVIQPIKILMTGGLLFITLFYPHYHERMTLGSCPMYHTSKSRGRLITVMKWLSGPDFPTPILFVFTWVMAFWLFHVDRIIAYLTIPKSTNTNCPCNHYPVANM